MSIKYLLLVGLALIAACQTAQDDYVDFPVPGYTQHNWYSGYFNITLAKDIHYVFFQSQYDRDNDPVIVWMNGGPACSSLYGMVYENGPFLFDVGKQNFKINPYSWNKKANVLYLETPAGVGFSRGPIDSNDANATFDAIYALRQFYARFPTYRKNKLFLSGEGYGGVFVPQLALRIHEENANPRINLKINLKGILLGNPCTEPNECYSTGTDKQSYYHYEYLYNHVFYTDRQFDEFKSFCSLGYNTGDCYNARVRMDNFFEKTRTSYYNIYSKCYNANGTKQKLLQNGALKIINMDCEDEYGMNIFFNDENIQTKLHVTPQNWSVCNLDMYRQYFGNVSNSYWIYPKLLASKNYTVWIYSGDLDTTVPILGTKRWISKLKEELDIPVIKSWRQWWVPGKHVNEDQVGGMVWELQGLTFASVKNAGFMVGRDQPQALSEILDAFLNAKRLPLTQTRT